MAELPSQEITQLLKEWGSGDRQALERLMPLVYPDLHLLARRRMSQERADHTLQPTALINEVYLQLIKYRNLSWQNRAHFFAMASTEMRRILVDHARKKRAEKRGGGADSLQLDDVGVASETSDIDLLALDEALVRLERLDPSRSRIVVMRVFGGLSVEEMAEELSVSVDTIRRKWNSAKTWLRREIEAGEHEEP